MLAVLCASQPLTSGLAAVATSRDHTGGFSSVEVVTLQGAHGIPKGQAVIRAPSIIRESPASLPCRSPESLVLTPGLALALAPRLERGPAATWPEALSAAWQAVGCPEPEAPSPLPEQEPTKVLLSVQVSPVLGAELAPGAWALVLQVPELELAPGIASALAPVPGLAPETAPAVTSTLGARPSQSL
jgi:hypothetical protein